MTPARHLSSNRRRYVAVALLAAIAGLGLAGAPVQDGGRQPPRVAAMAQLTRMLGEWDVSVAMGDGPTSPGTSVIRRIGDSSWASEEFKSTLGGQPFEGHGMLGFDQRTGDWASAWVDSSESHLSTGSGGWDVDLDAFVFLSPGMGDAPTKREVISFPDADSMLFLMGDERPEFKPEMVITYKRKR